MKFIIFGLTLALSTLSLSTSAAEGVTSLESEYSVNDTANRFEKLIQNKGLTLFGRIDHTQNAIDAGLSVRSTQVILFGNPLAGTPLMNCQQSVAIDLPQKALFWEDEQGKTWLTYNDPNYLKDRHNIEGCDAILEKISNLLSTLATAATSK